MLRGTGMRRKMDHKTLITRERLTAPHYLANNFVMQNVRKPNPGDKSLDFGSRRSELPMILSDLGYDAVALDRDPGLIAMQDLVAKRYNVPRKWKCVCGSYPLLQEFSHCEFKLVTAIWAIQHNSFQEQWHLLASLLDVTATGGEVIVVSSYCHTGSKDDQARVDPQLIVGPTELELLTKRPYCEMTKQEFFWYSHGTIDGEYCEPERANATAYILRKLS